MSPAGTEHWQTRHKLGPNTCKQDNSTHWRHSTILNWKVARKTMNSGAIGNHWSPIPLIFQWGKDSTNPKPSDENVLLITIISFALKLIKSLLVGGFNPSEKYESMERIILYIMENKKSSKPPTRLSHWGIPNDQSLSYKPRISCWVYLQYSPTISDLSPLKPVLLPNYTSIKYPSV